MRMGERDDLENSCEDSRAARDAAGRRLWAALRLKGAQLMREKR